MGAKEHAFISEDLNQSGNAGPKLNVETFYKDFPERGYRHFISIAYENTQLEPIHIVTWKNNGDGFSYDVEHSPQEVEL